MDSVHMLADSEICRRIGEKIRHLRLRQNISQTFLAKQAQISISTLKRVEEGEIRSFDALMRLLRVLGKLDVFFPLVKEEEMSPNEYYEFVEGAKKKQRKRAKSKKSDTQPDTQKESEW